MSKSSCLPHPPKEPLVIIRKWQVAFCEGNVCAAALLSFYEYWHNIKLEMQAKNIKSNDIAEMHHEARTHDESLLQFHTLDELALGILGIFSKSTIAKANKYLEEKGAIAIFDNPNPRYKFDRTRYVLFKPEICIDWMERRKTTASSAARAKQDVNDIVPIRSTGRDQKSNAIEPVLQLNPESKDGHVDKGEGFLASVDENSVVNYNKKPVKNLDVYDKNDNFQDEGGDVSVGFVAAEMVNSSPISALRDRELNLRSRDGKITTSNRNFTSRCSNFTSRCANFTSPESKITRPITEITTETTSEKTTTAKAAVVTPQGVIRDSKPLAAVVPFVDCFILHGKLSASQVGFVEQFVAKHIERMKHLGNVDVLKQALVFELEDPQSFSQAGNHFLKKLNTLKKAIANHTWSPSIWQQAVESGRDEGRVKLTQKIRELELSRQSFVHALDEDLGQVPAFRHSCGLKIKHYDALLAPLCQALRQLEAARPRPLQPSQPIPSQTNHNPRGAL